MWNCRQTLPTQCLPKRLQQLLVWITARNEQQPCHTALDQRRSSSSYNNLVGHSRFLFFGRFIPIFPLSLPSSFYPPTLTVQPSPGSSARDPGGASKDNLGLPNHITKSLAEYIQMLWEHLPCNIPRLQTHMYAVISPWHYLYWWQEINLNCMGLKWQNFAWAGELIGRAKSMLQFDTRTFLLHSWEHLGCSKGLLAVCKVWWWRNITPSTAWAHSPAAVHPSQCSHDGFIWTLLPEPQSSLSGH